MTEETTVSKKRWYVLQAFSGFESRVALTLREYIKQQQMEDQFGEVYNDTFVNNLQYVIERYMNTVDYPSYAELENSMTTDIENAKSFEEIKFSEPYIQQLNDDLSQGLYTK